MAITMQGSDGIFTRLGKIFQVCEVIEDHQTDGTNGLKEEMEDIVDEYTAADAFMMAGLQQSILATQLDAGNPIAGILRSVAQTTVIEMVNADTNKLPDRTLKTALVELIQQMNDRSYTIQTNGSIVSSASAKSAGNTGNGTIITAVTKATAPNAGDELQNCRAERIEVRCETDAQFSGTAGRETFTIKGQPATGDIRNPDFPDGATATQGLGSGASQKAQVTDPSQNAKQSVGLNMLYNSAFETFTVSNTPDNWVLNTGAAGTDFLEEGTVVYRGSKCLELVGDGATAHDMSQALNTSGQSTAKMEPEKKYCCFFRCSAAGSSPTGTVRFSIKDGSNNILDSGAAAVSIDISTVSTGGTFDLNSFTFNSPTALPSTIKFVIDATSAIGSSDILYIDDLCLCEMHQIGGLGGTYAVIVPGSTAFVRDDAFFVNITNDHAGTIQKWSDRLFGMYAMGLQFPIGTSPVIADSLVA